MSVSIQNFRSEVAGESPDFLCPGQLAFNLANEIMFLGDGTNQRTDTNGNPVLPNPPAGKGWRAYQLGGSGGGAVTSVTGSGAITAAPTVGDVILSALSASTSQAGVVQLTDSTSTTSSTTALTATGAKNLQEQINSLAVSSNLTFAGTISGTTGFMATVTTEGTAAGFTVGSVMPTSASGNAEFFSIITTAGTMTPPGGVATSVHPGDWWLSTGTGYQLIDAGQPDPVSNATPITAGVVLGCTTSDANINTFLGYRAGRCTAAGGAANVLLGACAGAALATGEDNVFVGVLAGRIATASTSNTYIGSQSGRNQTVGDNNTFAGSGSGAFSSGGSNTYVGFSTGYNLTGEGNTALGGGSLSASGISGCFNTALGGCSMSLVPGTVSKNTVVGYCTALSNEGCNNVAIGYNVQLPVAANSCQLAIGFEDGQFWLTGDSTKAIKPGAGITDCASSTGTAGQVLMSNGANAICWGTAAGGGGTVTSITAGGGLTGGTITASGTIALNTACVVDPLAYRFKGTILAGCAVGIPWELNVGTNGQVLTADSTCTTGIKWATAASASGCVSCTTYGGIGGVLVATSANTPGRLAPGTAGNVLTVDYSCSGYIKWAPGSAAAATATALGTLYGRDIPANDSVYIGYGAGLNGTACSNNTALGSNAMGLFSGASCTPTAVSNSIAIGQWALGTGSTQGIVTNTIAIGNRALGSGSGVAAGDGNVFIGNFTGANKGTGDCSVVIGHSAGAATWTAGCGNNTIIGAGANSTVVNGNNNTVLGWTAQPVSGASNSVTLGNSSITVVRAQVTSITALSDARDKTAITALPVGLDFINSLNPVKFTWQMREPNEVKDGTSEAGFIAQDLQTAQNAAEADYLGLVYDVDSEKLEASPGKLIPVLVKAIQELAKKIEILENLNS